MAERADGLSYLTVLTRLIMIKTFYISTLASSFPTHPLWM
jgi:hypothetical protein